MATLWLQGHLATLVAGRVLLQLVACAALEAVEVDTVKTGQSSMSLHTQVASH